MSSSQQCNNRESKLKGLRLPKPDAANITVLTPNLPNKPILPWSHFDSPWLEDTHEVEESPDQRQMTNDK